MRVLLCDSRNYDDRQLLTAMLKADEPCPAGISIDAVTGGCAADALRLGLCCHADTRRSSAKNVQQG